MAIATSLTNYTGTKGGATGFFNPGGWNTTLTAPSTQPKELCGTIRIEGANEYVYALAGSDYGKGAFMALRTGMTDGYSGLIAPITLTQLATSVATDVGKMYAVAICTVPATNYGWFLRAGFAYGNYEAGSAAAFGFVCPSTTTINLLANAATSTRVGVCVEENTAGVASAAGAGVCIYFDLRGIRGK